MHAEIAFTGSQYQIPQGPRQWPDEKICASFLVLPEPIGDRRGFCLIASQLAFEFAYFWQRQSSDEFPIASATQLA